MKQKLLIALMALTLAAPAFAQQPPAAPLAPMAEDSAQQGGWMLAVIDWYDLHMNYWTVGALMAWESSFVPLPSEIVIPPAVYVASDPQSQTTMVWWMIVLFGTLGALLGAYINYFLSRWLGRPIIYWFCDSKIGHLLLLSGEKMEKAEAYFNKHGNISTLIGRMVPVVRQLISIPAGLAKMPLGPFTLYTTLGAVTWNCLLALLGYLAYRLADRSVIALYSHYFTVGIFILIGAVLLFLIVKSLLKRRKCPSQSL